MRVLELAVRVVKGEEELSTLVSLLEEAGVDEEDIERVVEKAGEYVEAYEEGDKFAPAVFAAFVQGIIDRYTMEDRLDEVAKFAEEYARERLGKED